MELINDKDIINILKKGAEFFIDTFIKNVYSQSTWNGDPLMENSPSWKAFKINKGYGDMSLIYKDHDFINPNMWNIKVKDNNMITVQMANRLNNKLNDLRLIDDRYGKNYTKIVPDNDLSIVEKYIEKELMKLLKFKLSKIKFYADVKVVV